MGGILASIASAACAETLALLPSNASGQAVTDWNRRADGGRVTSLLHPSDSDPAFKRLALSSRTALSSTDITDLVIIGRSLGADWVLQPGTRALLVSTAHLQGAYLSQTDSVEDDHQAMETAMKAISEKAPTAGQLEQVASRWLERGQPDPALLTLRDVETLESGRVMTLLLMGEAYRQKGEFREAKRLLRMGLKAHPGELRLLEKSAEVDLTAGDPRSALQALNNVPEAQAGDPTLHRMKGRVYMSLGTFRLAEEEYRQAGTSSEVQSVLAKLAARRGDWPAASELAAKVVELAPDDWEMRFLALKSLSTGRRYAEAAKERAHNLVSLGDSDFARENSARPVIEEAIRDQVADLINGIRRLQLESADDSTLYSAAQQSVIAADRLNATLRGRTDWEEGSTAGKQRLLALSLWSQGSYDLVKALESKDRSALNDPGDLLHDALKQLDDARQSGTLTGGATQRVLRQ